MVAEVLEFKPRTITLPGDIRILCVQFLRHKALRGLAINSQAAYKSDLEQFVGFLLMRDKTLIQSVHARDLDNFFDALILGGNCSRRTAARKQASVKGLLAFAVKQGVLTDFNNPARHMEQVKFKAERVIAPEESAILKLLDAIPRGTTVGIRDAAWLRLMFDGGLRVGGVISLQLYDADHPPRFMIKPSGVVLYCSKGGECKDTVVDDVTLQYVDRWLAVRSRFKKSCSGTDLFLTERGGALSRQVAHHAIKKYGKAVGMPDIHCHLLRHRRLGDALDKGGLPLAHYLSGHADPSITAAIYGQQSRERLRQRVLTEIPVGSGVGSQPDSGAAPC